ncbi:hypothetical protein [Actinomadura madurae]|uniref:hypothetical protein n=1 Tax=Actinomadura madurae TaxID=1993 RepID=UPI0020D24ABE|nr:hypothetical protein [Actinomadura madurae]MCQ0021517.1 hypothetical protein [Actinomadura madurae]
MITSDWERRIADLWASFDDHEPAAFLAAVEELAGELPPGDAVAEYEIASAHDSIGNEAGGRRPLPAGVRGRAGWDASPRGRSSTPAPCATSAGPRRASRC